MKFVFFDDAETGKDIAVPADGVTGLKQTKIGTEIRVRDGYVYETLTGIRVVAEELERACSMVIVGERFPDCDAKNE